MPRLFVATAEDKYDNVPKKVATSGESGLKKELREYPNTKWSVKFYNFKPNGENICLLATGKLKAESKFKMEVSSGGRVRKS